LGVYVSTGGVRDRTCTTVAEELFSQGFESIELSGGLYDPELEKSIVALKERGADITLHNYIPLQETPYVLNLASDDDQIFAQTDAHIRRAIDLSAMVGSPWYAFHAGFLIDPQPNELGKRISRRDLQSRSVSMGVFKARVSNLAEYAASKNVNLLVENNVLSMGTRREFDGNPLLLCETDEITEFFESLEGAVTLLLDVAHLKVSANALGFDQDLAFDLLEPYVGGLHLSDNDGRADQNLPFEPDAWFFNKNIKRDYKVIEVYDYDEQLLRKQIDYVEKLL
jgi:sugar phosphate isomerase/epimerase